MTSFGTPILFPDSEFPSQDDADFDDSSIEGCTLATGSNDPQYDVSKQCEKFLRLLPAAHQSEKYKYKSAFYSHALGIQILRHPTVMKYYSGDKKKDLKHTYDKVLIDRIKDWIKENVKLTIVRLPGSTNNNESANFHLDCENLIDSIMSHKNRLLSLLNRRSNYEARGVIFTDKEIQSNLSLLKSDLSSLTFKFEKLKFYTVSNEMIMQDSKCKKLMNKIKSALGNDLKECFKCFQLSEYGNVLFATVYKDDTIEKLEKLPESLAKTAALNYYNSLTKGSATKKFKQDLKTEALQIALENIRGTQKNINGKKLHRNELLVSGLLKPATSDDLEVIIQRNLDHTTFLHSLLDNLQSSRSDLFRQHGIERVILPPVHLFDLSGEEKDFFPRFLATLNLCNRSSRRHLRNLRDDNLQRLTDEVHPRSWKFPQSPYRSVIDNHKFTTKGNRKDETLELGGYTTVNELIEAIKNNLNKNRVEAYLDVTDGDIASWIRSIINGKPIVQNGALVCRDENVPAINQFKKLTDKMIAQLIKITYLLFGSEVMRNPASLIHHQMMIDLILVNKMTWKDALHSKRKIKIKKTEKEESDGGEMPMSMKEAVPSARILHNRFLPFMPYPYYYDPLEADDDDNAAREDELLDREHAIYEKWFTDYMKMPNRITLFEDTDKQVLSEAVKRWYGVDFELKQLNKRLAVIQRSDSFMDSLLNQSEFTELDDTIGSLSLLD